MIAARLFRRLLYTRTPMLRRIVLAFAVVVLIVVVLVAAWPVVRTHRYRGSQRSMVDPSRRYDDQSYLTAHNAYST